MFYGYLDLSWWGYVVYTAIVTHITIAAVTIYLHRCQAHRALDLHPIISHFFRFWLWLTTGMMTKAWAAIHRKHHSKCETKDDPHSPQVMGLHTVMWYGAELYRKEAKVRETLDRFGKGTPDDWLERNVYTPKSQYGLYLLFFVNILLLGVPGMIVWAIQIGWIPFFAAGVINGIGHYFGYRNFECKDASTNIFPIGLLIGGEELHNNHHTYSSSAKLSVKPWEFDIGWLYIRLFEIFGLAKVKRLPPKAKILASKEVIDIETVKAVISDRFQIMADYSKGVVIPVVNQIADKAVGLEKSTLKRVKSIICREVSLVDPEGKQNIDKVLSKNQTLNIVYQFGQKLQSIWDHTTATQKELLDALQDWCHQAEETGINYLQEFVSKIKGYSVLRYEA